MKVNWFLVKMILISAFLFFLMAFSYQRNHARSTRNLEVRFVENSQPFMAIDSVNKLFIQNDDSLASILKETLALKEMEARLTQHPMVYQAQVFISIDGNIGAKIKTKRPIGRVLSEPGFYIDEQGQPMPLSNRYTARVPIVTGPVLLHLEALKKVLLTLRDDDFFGPRITEVAVKEDGTFELRLRHENYFLCLGPSTDLTRKLRNFKAFYQSMEGDSEQMKYKKIDLRFNNQVVATE